ncbi:hypothetical protein HY967_03445 [Candidatus Jorgensenbacteria bacterium]|nr:hypothetical protein [Candidatus Jorgensenbacteria bacterium]
MKHFIQCLFLALSVIIEDPYPVLAGTPFDSSKSKIDSTVSKNSLGLGVIVSTGGPGFGLFYRRELAKNVHGVMHLSISGIKDKSAPEWRDVVSAGDFTSGRVNRFVFVPFTLGLEYRLWSDDIVDNFKPYLTGGIGPSLIYAMPVEHDFMGSIGHGQAHHGINGFVGFGAWFGSPKELSGISLRLYSIHSWQPVPSYYNGWTSGVVARQDFVVFFLTLSVGWPL